MTISEVSKRTDKTPLGTLLSVLTSFEVLARYLEIELQHHGASLIRFNIMSTLFKNGGEMTPSEIAESVFREKNSITAVINTLEKQGVVRREPSPDDGRSVKVVITDKGWKEANRLNPISSDRPGYRPELTRAARKSQTAQSVPAQQRRRSTPQFRQTYKFQCLSHPLFDLRPWYPESAMYQREGDVFEDRHVRPDGVRLEYHTDAALVRRNCHPLTPRKNQPFPDVYFPTVRSFQPRHAPQRSRLPAARRAKQGQEGAFGDFKTDSPDCRHRSVRHEKGFC